MKTSNKSIIEDFLRSSVKYNAEKDYSYWEEQRYLVAAALEPERKIRNKSKDFLEV